MRAVPCRAQQSTRHRETWPSPERRGAVRPRPACLFRTVWADAVVQLALAAGSGVRVLFCSMYHAHGAGMRERSFPLLPAQQCRCSATAVPSSRRCVLCSVYCSSPLHTSTGTQYVHPLRPVLATLLRQPDRLPRAMCHAWLLNSASQVGAGRAVCVLYCVPSVTWSGVLGHLHNLKLNKPINSPNIVLTQPFCFCFPPLLVSFGLFGPDALVRTARTHVPGGRVVI